MGGFFRKVAGAFVYLDEEPEEQRAPDAAQLDIMAREASELFNQLGGTPQPEAAPGRGSFPQGEGAQAAVSVMDMTADQVFDAAALGEGPNSARRVLKIVAGLAMFPKEQQVVMVRAMDAADDAWSEKDVLDDARLRQSTLRNHVQAIEGEKTERLRVLAAEVETVQTQSQQTLAEIDRQVAELQQRREATIASASASLAELEHRRKQIEESAEKARRGITSVINALSELITFFTGSDARSPG